MIWLSSILDKAYTKSNETTHTLPRSSYVEYNSEYSRYLQIVYQWWSMLNAYLYAYSSFSFANIMLDYDRYDFLQSGN